jgi:hypothetical protein
MGGGDTPEARLFRFFSENSQNFSKFFTVFQAFSKLFGSFLEANTVAPYHLNH